MVRAQHAASPRTIPPARGERQRGAQEVEKQLAINGFMRRCCRANPRIFRRRSAKGRNVTVVEAVDQAPEG